MKWKQNYYKTKNILFGSKWVRFRQVICIDLFSIYLNKNFPQIAQRTVRILQ